MKSVCIKEVSLYHPEKVVDNEFYIRHFKQRGKDIKHFIKDIMGRDKRYIIDNDHENGLTMAIEAAKRVLHKANLEGKDIDMIVFSTQTPEYTFPTNAMLIHHEIKGKHETICMDSNSNCAGMLVAVEQTSRYMMANPSVQYALVIGSDYNSINCNSDDEVTYANYGDAAAAIILEKTDNQPGFIDSIYYSDTSAVDNVLFPACGLSNIYQNGITNKDIQIRWIPFDGTVCVDPALRSMDTLLKRHDLCKDDIGAYCFSQFSWKNIEFIQTKFGIDPGRIVYVGDEFGYTGTSSPFLALCRGIERGQIQRGDYVVFWSVGTGWQIITMLFNY